MDAQAALLGPGLPWRKGDSAQDTKPPGKAAAARIGCPTRSRDVYSENLAEWATGGLTLKGSAALETAMFLPILILLMMGTLEIARITYTYYTLHKIMYSLARYVSTQQGVNFCDSSDPNVTAAKSFALTGTTDSTAPSILPNLTPDMISIRIEQADATGGSVTECACAVPGCDTANGGVSPDYVVVSIPDGYAVTPHIPLVSMNPIPLRPQIRVPYGGT